MSFWDYPTSPDEIWHTLTELHSSTQVILYRKEEINNQKFLQAGHFFAAALNMSHRMM
ncbi:MAG TPA: hypothetical protein VMR81_07960 [Patescibacteria group bacterium]|nr:hypothetical protein [Patescibacteria group bacterium]